MIEITMANLKLISFLVPVGIKVGISVGVLVGVVDGDWVGVCVGKS